MKRFVECADYSHCIGERSRNVLEGSDYYSPTQMSSSPKANPSRPGQLEARVQNDSTMSQGDRALTDNADEKPMELEKVIELARNLNISGLIRETRDFFLLPEPHTGDAVSSGNMLNEQESQSMPAFQFRELPMQCKKIEEQNWNSIHPPTWANQGSTPDFAQYGDSRRGLGATSNPPFHCENEWNYTAFSSWKSGPQMQQSAPARTACSANSRNHMMTRKPHQLNPMVSFRRQQGLWECFQQRRCLPYSSRELVVHKSIGEYGTSNGQFNMPQGLCLGMDDDIVVADTLNHRIQIFDRHGQFKLLWGNPGVKRGHLWHPRKVAFLPRSQRIAVSDRVNGCSRIQIFEYLGAYVNTLGHLHGLRMALNTTTAGMAVYQDQLVVVEVQPPACIVMQENGTAPHWFSLEGIMVEPSDVAVADHKFFISDFRGHCVCIFDIYGRLINRLGGMADSIIQYPRGIGLTQQGHLLVADTDTNRFHLSVWNIHTAVIIGHHTLANQKVSHSCGIVMKQNGCLITAMKKDHKILILKPASTLSESSCPPQRGLNVHAPCFHVSGEL